MGPYRTAKDRSCRAELLTLHKSVSTCEKEEAGVGVGELLMVCVVCAGSGTDPVASETTIHTFERLSHAEPEAVGDEPCDQTQGVLPCSLSVDRCQRWPAHGCQHQTAVGVLTASSAHQA